MTSGYLCVTTEPTLEESDVEAQLQLLQELDDAQDEMHKGMIDVAKKSMFDISPLLGAFYTLFSNPNHNRQHLARVADIIRTASSEENLKHNRNMLALIERHDRERELARQSIEDAKRKIMQGQNGQSYRIIFSENP